MHIDKLLIRENFYLIFKTTLEKFYLNKYKKDISISWNKKVKKNFKNYFLVNPKLNIIYHNSISTKNINPYINHFFYHKNYFRSILQELYLKITVSSKLRNYFSSYKFTIEPFENCFEQVLFCGGNHSISVISLKDQTTTQILKVNYDPNFIKSSIETRLKFADLPIPKIIDYSKDGLWVKQDWINGMPINRLSSRKLFQKCLIGAQESMINIYMNTIQMEKINLWIDYLKFELETSISKLSKIYDYDFKTQLKKIIKVLVENFFSKDSFSKDIFTAITHGDFSSSNILYTNDYKFKNNFFLIDWDYASRRFIIYDFFVNKLNARSYKLIDFLKKIDLFMLNSMNFGINEKFIFSKYCYELNNFELLGLFLLEDLNVRLKENFIPNLKKPNPDLEIYLKTLNLITKKYV